MRRRERYMYTYALMFETGKAEGEGGRSAENPRDGIGWTGSKSGLPQAGVLVIGCDVVVGYAMRQGPTVWGLITVRLVLGTNYRSIHPAMVLGQGHEGDFAEYGRL